MGDFFRDLVDDLKDEDTSIAADGLGAAEYTGTVDTGSYILNGVLSGSLYGGVPNNKVTAFAGENATGKTFFVLGVVGQFLTDNPTGGIIYYDTEAAVTKNMMVERGLDPSRVIISEPDTIQKFRSHVVKSLDMYEKTPEDSRPPMMLVCDSLGLLSTEKEIADTLEGKDVRDMTKSQLIKGAFRVITLKCAKLNVPMLVTNHVYEVIGSYIPMKEMGGGSGLKYAASTIAYLSKRKVRDGTEIIGNEIKVKMYKSRLAKENSEVTVSLDYKKGLDRYFGLPDLGEKHGIFKKSGNRLELPDGSKVYVKAMLKEPEKYIDPYLEQLEEAAQKEFCYGEIT